MWDGVPAKFRASMDLKKVSEHAGSTGPNHKRALARRKPRDGEGTNSLSLKGSKIKVGTSHPLLQDALIRRGQKSLWTSAKSCARRKDSFMRVCGIALQIWAIRPSTVRAEAVSKMAAANMQ